MISLSGLVLVKGGGCCGSFRVFVLFVYVLCMLVRPCGIFIFNAIGFIYQKNNIIRFPCRIRKVIINIFVNILVEEGKKVIR